MSMSNGNPAYPDSFTTYGGSLTTKINLKKQIINLYTRLELNIKIKPNIIV